MLGQFKLSKYHLRNTYCSNGASIFLGKMHSHIQRHSLIIERVREEERKRERKGERETERQRHRDTGRHKRALFTQINDNIRSLREEHIEKIGMG